MTSSPTRSLRNFSRRQTLRTAIVIGLLLGVIMGAQGPAYQAAYPTAASRQAFVATLDGTPALGSMSGETINASEPASYAVYKSIVISTLITSIWGVVVMTKLLRGQEENGRMELIQSGNLGRRQSSAQLILGFFESIIISAAIAFVFIAALGQLSHVGLGVGRAGLLTAAVYLPGLVFAGLSVLTSQLASTRGRALMYSLLPLIILMVIRAFANSDSTINWLKNITPFGWSDLLNPVLHPHTVWLIPSLITIFILTALGYFLADRRDFAQGVWNQNDTARSSFSFLRTPFSVAMRVESLSFVWWSIGAFGFTVFITSIAKLSVSIVKDADGAQRIIGKLGGRPDNMAIAFIGIGSLFTALILLIMATVMLGRIRHAETSGQLDNMLVQPVSRYRWLLGRIGLIIGASVFIALVSSIFTWYIAQHESIVGLKLSYLIANGIGIVALVTATFAAGIVAYGYRPRLGTACMAIIIGWSYIVDIFKSLLNLPNWIEKTSIFDYLSTSLTSTPKWTTVSWLLVISIVLITIGCIGFTNRDIVSE